MSNFSKLNSLKMFHGYVNVVIYGEVTIEGWISNSYLTINAASY